MKVHLSDPSAVPLGYKVVAVINLPVTWRRYAARLDRIEAKHPGVRSFPGGNQSIFAIKPPEPAQGVTCDLALWVDS